ncbi:MAG: cation acetate symporter, partial [Tetrasphaera sp.]|nr:cation acetate symporter [Tetrasphaera sp.]
ATIVTVVVRPENSWLATALSQPAAWCIPASFATSVIVSLLTPDRIPSGVSRTMARLHTPEGVELSSVR